MKFETAYCSYKQKEFTIDEISHIYRQNIMQFDYEYKGFLYCPECKCAKLSYHNAAHPYFSAYPKAKHEEDCSLSQETIPSSKSEKYVNDTANKKSIENQMDHLILLLSDQQELVRKDSSISKKLSEDQSCFSLDRSVSIQSKKLPRKRIDISWRPDDYDCYKLFYGTIYLKWEKYEEGYKILMYPRKGDRLMCKLRVKETVYQYLPNYYKILDAFSCHIVFVASFSEKENKKLQDKKYRTTYLVNSNRIKIVKI